ncbi:MAG: glucosaminidase domain-containing protein [Paludibacteraceae bacterium]|nr:glucosaminidase domain-containing protein [Paludibacteraceae bacterium]
MRKFSFTIIALLTLASSISAATKKLQVNIDYINRYSQIAVEKMREHRIPASITLAQGILESGAGQSELAKKSNNHFGIKCHNDWTGERVYHDDDEKQECFRKYSKPELSYEDHSQFLKKKRYESLFELNVTDYKGWAKGLKACGYATAKDYAERLIDLIETYDLQQYDQIALGKLPTDVITPGDKTDKKDKVIEPIVNNEVKYLKNSSMGTIPVCDTHFVRKDGKRDAVVAQRGDSYESVADEFGLRKWQIRRYNKIKRGDNARPNEGDLIYISK